MITVKAGTTKPFDQTLRRGGEALDLTNKTVTWTIEDQDFGSEMVSGTGQVLGAPTEGLVRVEWEAEEGLFYLLYRVTDSGGDAEYVPNAGYETILVEPADHP